MKFIIPQNYNFKNKLFGFMDYSTAIFNIVWIFIVFLIISLFHVSLNTKIGIFITLYFPLLLFSVFGFNNESIVYVIFYMFKFIKNRRVYFFNKDWFSFYTTITLSKYERVIVYYLFFLKYIYILEVFIHNGK